MRRKIAAFLCMTLGFSAPAAAELWKWVDAQGQTHYSDTPPADVKASPVGGGISVIPSLEAPAAPAKPAPPSPPTAPAAASGGNAQTGGSNSAAELKAKRARMIERCEKDRGVDCEESVDAMLDGPIPRHYEQPVWVYPYPQRPPIRPHPRPPAKPAPKPAKEEPEMPMLPFPKPVNQK
ncbi:DUF4124 domain-containing protein [Niveibacterium sp. 24ML]|uniref:DUF4124 domain-containing protein n=1 Tax=Niveibacterium sp. 24ML TaxID=2985512 RepID=UPI002271E318|nr:DUF4124 domain-containing protein [Niveibacterium sp. 24ML]MCX9155017.1 DUF4124 domain-containing protein [Niveibacterium sp. 24ML]